MITLKEANNNIDTDVLDGALSLFKTSTGIDFFILATNKKINKNFNEEQQSKDFSNYKLEASEVLKEVLVMQADTFHN